MSLYSAQDVCRIRRANHMTQQQFADHMAVTRRTVIRWEQSGVGWRNYGLWLDRLKKLEQPDLPLRAAE